MRILKLILLLGFLTPIFEISGQEFLLGNDVIGSDARIDSLFRTNFRSLENYEQTFVIKDPGFSVIDYYEPTNSKVHMFVELLVRVSGIKCDSVIQQKDWKNSYCTWDTEKIEAWERWYMQNGKNLNWQEVVATKEDIESKWISK